MEEPPYAALQREVQRKLGRCLIRIQQYELLLKEMVAKREVSAILGCNLVHLVESQSSSTTRTMGQLIGELTGKYFQVTPLEPGEAQPDAASKDDEHQAGWARVAMSVSMQPDSHAKLTEELQELVDLRNDLVHHFVEGQDLVTEEGCIAADMYLQDCYLEIDRQLISLQGWAAASNEAARSMAAFMESPEFKTFLMAELSSSTSQREAALPNLVELLKRAEENYAQAGWTALSAAIEFAKAVAPHETPRKHSFGSWRQVLHEARVFEIQRRLVSAGGSKETLYRTRS